MQTFLPYASFEESARVIDRQRLGCQRKEAMQILSRLLNPSAKGWLNHPAVKMWKGSEIALCSYGRIVCLEWIRRGYKDSQLALFDALMKKLESDMPMNKLNPSWLGVDRVHSAYRSALLYKLPEWYGQFGWKEAPAVPDENGSLPYVWMENVTE